MMKLRLSVLTVMFMSIANGEITIVEDAVYPYYFIDRDYSKKPADFNEWIYPDDKDHDINKAYIDIGWMGKGGTRLYLGKFANNKLCLDLLSIGVVGDPACFYKYIGRGRINIDNDPKRLASIEQYGKYLGKMDLFFCSPTKDEMDLILRCAMNMQVLGLPYAPQAPCAELTFPKKLKKLVIYNDRISAGLLEKLNNGGIEELVLWGCSGGGLQVNRKKINFQSLTLINCDENVHKLLSSYEYPSLVNLTVDGYEFAAQYTANNIDPKFPEIKNYNYYGLIGIPSSTYTLENHSKMAQSTVRALRFSNGVTLKLHVSNVTFAK